MLLVRCGLGGFPDVQGLDRFFERAEFGMQEIDDVSHRRKIASCVPLLERFATGVHSTLAVPVTHTGIERIGVSGRRKRCAPQADGTCLADCQREL